MPYQPNYPETVAEILDDRMTFKPAALRAVRELARSKPWQGTQRERLLKLRLCLPKLADAYDIPCPNLARGAIDCFVPAFNSIYLRRSHLSVVSFLHEFSHARGFDERKAVRWSVNLFRRCFPRSYASCRHERHMLINDARRSAERSE